VLEVIGKGAAQSWQMDNRGKTMIADKFEFGFAVDWMRKDLGPGARRSQAQRRAAAGDGAGGPVLCRRAGAGRQRWDTSSLITRLR
jgi:3-hydroxyisobutyrate dehydrogenase